MSKKIKNGSTQNKNEYARIQELDGRKQEQKPNRFL